MHKLIEYICDELEELERKADKEGKLSMAEIEYIDKLAHIKKSILSADEMWEDSEYSNAMGGGSYEGSYARGGQGGGGGRGGSSRAGGGSYGGGSYARGRGRGARRDAMGRYSREGGYSRAEDDFKMELEELMQDAPNDQMRQRLKSIIGEM